MALVLADRVRDTTTTTGTGTVTLSGTAPTGYQNFSVVGNGNTTYYTINAGSQWEVGLGTYSSTGPTLARTTVLSSSNGGSLVDFSTGTKDVFVTYPAEKSINEDASGNVGIGTTSPASKLDVSGAGASIGARVTNTTASGFGSFEFSDGTITKGQIWAGNGSYASFGGAGSLNYSANSGPHVWYTNYSERIRIDTSGNVGIGTSSPGAALHVFGNNGVFGTNSFFGLNGSTSGIAIGNNGTVGLIQGQATATSSTAANIGIQVNGGNVGIGTSSPGAKFQVIGSTTVGGYANVAAAFGAGVSSELYVGSLNGNNPYIGSGGAFPLSFNTNSAERMRIDSSGNVGIGTSSPGQKLDVGAGGSLLLSGASTGDQFIRIGSGRSGNGYSFIDLQGDTTYNNGLRLIRTNSGANSSSNIEHRGTGSLALITQEAAPISFLTSATERMRIDSSGNVGIGTSSPGVKLDVKGLVRSSIGTGTGAGGAGYAFYQFGTSATASENWHIGAEGDGSFRFYNQGFGAGTERMRITSGGNVGIGKTPAFGLLDVNGAIFATDDGTYSFGRNNGSNSGGWKFDSTNPSIVTYVGNGSERMRIDSSGNLLVGATAIVAYFDGKLNVAGRSHNKFSSNADYNYVWNATTTGDAGFMHFGTEASYTTRGTITYNRAGGITVYATTSDYRAKDILGPVTDAGVTIDALKVYNGKMHGATIVRPMLIAHEAQEVTPYAVTGEKDAVNEDGTDKHQQMDVSSLVPLLIAEVQSLRARVAQLEGN